MCNEIRKPTEHGETQELSDSDLENATGGWGVVAGLANSLTSTGGKKQDKGTDNSKDTVMVGLLIG
jgi:hypothetical protein